jgi:hypothetical protein
MLDCRCNIESRPLAPQGTPQRNIPWSTQDAASFLRTSSLFFSNSHLTHNMDEGTSQANRMFVRDEDDLTTHEKAWLEAQDTIQAIHQEPNMDSMEDPEKLVMRHVATLALGSRPRQRELQACGPKGSPGVKPKGSPGAKAKRSPRPKARGSPGVTSHTPGMLESVRE